MRRALVTLALLAGLVRHMPQLGPTSRRPGRRPDGFLPRNARGENVV
jgi:hypothetical protein